MPIAMLVFVVSASITYYVIVRRVRKRGHEDFDFMTLINGYAYLKHRYKLTECERRARWAIPVCCSLVTLAFVELALALAD